MIWSTVSGSLYCDWHGLATADVLACRSVSSYRSLMLLGHCKWFLQEAIHQFRHWRPDWQAIHHWFEIPDLSLCDSCQLAVSAVASRFAQCDHGLGKSCCRVGLHSPKLCLQACGRPATYSTQYFHFCIHESALPLGIKWLASCIFGVCF